MTISTNAIMKVVTDIMGDQQIQITTRQPLERALMVGTVVLPLGILVAGPIGLAASAALVGAASGAAVASAAAVGAVAFATNGTFKPIRQILNKLSSERKRAIAIKIQVIIDKLEINDLAEFTKVALMYGAITSTNPQKFLVEKFIQESISVIQRQMLLEN